MLARMREIPGLKLNVPDGAFYLFPEVTSYFGKKYGDFVINNATDLSMFLLDQAHVAIVPGAAFGDDNYVRLSYATSEDRLEEAARRMKEALAKLA